MITGVFSIAAVDSTAASRSRYCSSVVVGGMNTCRPPPRASMHSAVCGTSTVSRVVGVCG